MCVIEQIGNPPPGSPGGGALPGGVTSLAGANAQTLLAAQALALLPAGLSAVAIVESLGNGGDPQCC